MTNQQNIANAQQKFIIQIDDKTLKRVKPHDCTELVQAYLELFSGFSWVNWTNTHSLGRAWQTAITQCGAFCESKNKKNPAAKYLNAVCNGYRKYWSQVIMTHKNRENTINPQDENVKHLREHGQRMIRQAMDQINLMLARYNEYTMEVSRSAAMGATAEYAGGAQYNNVPGKNVPMMEQGQTSTQPQAAMPMAQSGQVMQQGMAQRSAAKQIERAAAASLQQNSTVQKVDQAQRVAQPMQMAQVAKVQQQRPAVQNVAQIQRVAQPMQMAQVAKAQQQRPAVQNVAQAQRSIRIGQEKQKQPCIKPIARVFGEKKPYVAPQVFVRENQLAKQTKSAMQTKAALLVNAQQKIQRINMLMFRNFNQRAA